MAKTSLRFDRMEFEKRVQYFLDSLNIITKKQDLYYLAFVHKSVLNESTDLYSESNERLEFLWDAILELVITEILYHDFPQKTEGQLTDIRSAIVRGRNLANVAIKLWVSNVIQLSRWEFKVSGHENPYLLANAIEAIIGAIYLDFWLEAARNWILQNIYVTLPEILERGLYVDPKSYLQEITQEIWWLLPDYNVVREEWQDHNKTYIIQAMLWSVLLGEGRWSSKKKWEQDAAENAISNRKQWEFLIELPRKNLQKSS